MTDQERLEELRLDHPELNRSYMSDATVHAWFNQCMAGGCTLEEALIGALIGLQKEKDRYFKMALELTSMSTHPAPIMLPHGATLLGQDGDTERGISMPKLEKGSRVALNDFGTASGTYIVTGINPGESISLSREGQLDDPKKEA